MSCNRPFFLLDFVLGLCCHPRLYGVVRDAVAGARTMPINLKRLTPKQLDDLARQIDVIPPGARFVVASLSVRQALHGFELLGVDCSDVHRLK